MTWHTRTTAALVLAALAVSAAGCFNPFDPEIAPERSVTTPPPNPTTPRKLMLLFEWAYERQDIVVYEELFTDDYRFAFADEDSAGNPPLTRDDELQVARNLFIAGSATEPPANKITLDYATDIVPRDDSRPGKDATWHKEILVRVILRVETDDLTHQVDGKALFFVVRGDSAQIPEDLQLRGFGRDANRWYIERWEDQTGGLTSLLEAAAAARRTGSESATPPGSGAPSGLESAGPRSATNPSRNFTWGLLKRIYLAPILP